MKFGVTKLLLVVLLLGSFQCAPAVSAVITNNDAKTAHEAFSDKDFLKAGTFYEKAYYADKVEVYLENAITAYLHYSFDCLNEKDYLQAIKYCEKVLSIKSTDTNAKEILSDVYYSRGSKLFFRGDKQKAEIDLQKALAYSVLPEQKQRAKELLTKFSGKSKTYYQNPRIKLTSVNGSIPDLLELMELKIYGETFESKSVPERINKLEKDVLGKTYAKSNLVSRAYNLKKVFCLNLLIKKMIKDKSWPMLFSRDEDQK